MKKIITVFAIIFLVIHVVYDITGMYLDDKYSELKPYYLGMIGTALVLIYQRFESKAGK